MTTATRTLTTPLGELAYDDEQIVHLRGGVIGLAEAEHFLLVENADIEPLRWLVSTSVSGLSLPVIDPRILIADYRLTLTDEQTRRLELGDDKNRTGLLPLAITVLAEPAYASTANLKAPIVVNTKRMTGAQIVLVDSAYRIDHPLLPPVSGVE